MIWFQILVVPLQQCAEVRHEVCAWADGNSLGRVRSNAKQHLCNWDSGEPRTNVSSSGVSWAIDALIASPHSRFKINGFFQLIGETHHGGAVMCNRFSLPLAPLGGAH